MRLEVWVIGYRVWGTRKTPLFFQRKDVGFLDRMCAAAAKGNGFMRAAGLRTLVSWTCVYRICSVSEALATTVSLP